MSKLDSFTVLIVGLCLAALGYLVYKTIKLRELKNASPITSIQVQENKETTPPDTLTFDDEGRIVDPIAAEEGDLDDEDLSVNNGTLVEEEEGSADEDESPTQETEPIAAKEKEPEEEVPASFDTETAAAGDFLVLAGSFKQKANAEAQVRRLKQLGFDDARVASFNGGSLAVALVGRFTDAKSANKLATEVETKGIDAFVKRKN
ncbi:MAG: SPOR domain-containing protein [Saprospiraceae bacterium]|nr:SPOR domain-containing protein [Saprospiraceae bacterium]